MSAAHEHEHDGHEHEHDGHGHDEHDGHEHRRGLRGALAELVRPHSHDAADSTDTALESDRRGTRALLISFGVLMATALAQLVLIGFTGSVALVADTIHNFSDALTAVPLLIAFRLGRRPATSRYTFGYRRAEDLAGLFVVAMIALSAVIAGYEAIHRLVDPRPVEHVGWLFLAGVVGFIGNELVALYRIRVGRRIGSAALEADGQHARTDGLTSLAVAAGAVGAWLGFDRADPIVGLLISVAIVVVLVGAARQIFRRLMDAVDPAIVEQISDTAANVPGVEDVGTVRVRWIGHRLAASVSVVVDQDHSVATGHAIGEDVRRALTGSVRHLDHVDVHVDPCGHDGAEAHPS